MVERFKALTMRSLHDGMVAGMVLKVSEVTFCRPRASTRRELGEEGLLSEVLW